MNIYLVDRGEADFDEYNSFVCYAENEDIARQIHPRNNWEKEDVYQNWISKDKLHTLEVSYLGNCNSVVESKVILASYNAS